MNSTAPIRSRAAEEGSFEIPLWGIPFTLLLLYVSLFSGLGALGLVGPDEPRYAAIARAMAESHDWITPRLWGTPWFEKPVLYYWTAGIAMRLFGVSEFAARLPSALAALLAVVAVKWTALRSYGVNAAWFSLLMLPTSVAIIGFARAASPDMLFAGLLTAAMAVASEMLQKPKPGPISRIAFGFFLGAAVLAKGPAAIILAGGATLLWAALSRQWLAPFRFLHPLIVAVFCATALPWYILCAMRNPDFLRVFLWQHNFERYLTPVFQHPQPFWFFGPVLFVGILPWFPLLFSGFYDAARDFRLATMKDSPALFLGCWALFTLLFFTLSQSKLPGYILPSIPPVILLIASSLARQLRPRETGATLALAAVGLLFPVIAEIARIMPGFAIPQGIRLSPDPIQGLRIVLGAAVAGASVTVALVLRRRFQSAVYAAACTAVALIMIANRMVMPSLDAFISARPAALGIVNASRATPEEVAVYHLPRAFGYGLNYYFGRDLPEWTPENSKATFVFFSMDSLPELERLYRFAAPSTGGAISFEAATLDGKIYVKVGPRSGK